MKKEKRTRANNNGESASIQSKKTPQPLTELARRFHRGLDDVLEELDESLSWSQSDGEKIRLLTIRQNIGKLRGAIDELVEAKGCQSESKTPQETESAGHITARNTWIKIGFSPVEMAAMRKVRCSYKGNAGLPLSQIIRMLLVSSLAHYGAIVRCFSVDQNYARAEGFIGTEHYSGGDYQKSLWSKADRHRQMGMTVISALRLAAGRKSAARLTPNDEPLTIKSIPIRRPRLMPLKWPARISDRRRFSRRRNSPRTFAGIGTGSRPRKISPAIKRPPRSESRPSWFSVNFPRWQRGGVAAFLPERRELGAGRRLFTDLPAVVPQPSRDFSTLNTNLTSIARKHPGIHSPRHSPSRRARPAVQKRLIKVCLNHGWKPSHRRKASIVPSRSTRKHSCPRKIRKADAS